MGSYDDTANSVVNFSMIGCRMDNILDRSLWGVIETNHCKNILLEDCVLSRMDTHMGVSGTYTVRGYTLGYAGLNAIGRGLLTVEDSTLHGGSFITSSFATMSSAVKRASRISTSVEQLIPATRQLYGRVDLRQFRRCRRHDKLL